MPLTYQNPWNFSDTGNSLGELLARVPQIRAQQAMMQQQMMLEQQKIANEQQYQQGMLGYHQSSLAQQAPLITQQTAEAKAKTDESQKVMALAEMFAKASRKMYSPNQEPTEQFDYPSGQMIQTPNPMAQAGGDLTEGLSGLAALKPGMNPTETMLQLAARQQQGPFGVDQLNALLTGGHLNNPHVQTGFNLSPGQTHFDPSGQPVANLPEVPNSRRSAFEQFVINMGNQQAKSASDLPPNLQAEAMKHVWGLTNLLGGPQQAQQAQVPTVKTKEEYLKLPKGSKYIGPDGKLATKQ